MQNFKHMKGRRMFFFVFACILALTMFPLVQPAYAAGTILTVDVDSGSYKPGETFTAKINISDNPGFSGMALKISYPKGLELVNIQPVGIGMADLINLGNGLTLWEEWEYGELPPAPIADQIYAVWGRSVDYNFSS